MHQGDTYLVNYLDLSTKVAFCQRADLKYYTKTRDYTDVHVAGGELVSCSFDFKYALLFLLPEALNISPSIAMQLYFQNFATQTVKLLFAHTNYTMCKHVK